jgi:hypothetical protein
MLTNDLPDIIELMIDKVSKQPQRTNDLASLLLSPDLDGSSCLVKACRLGTDEVGILLHDDGVDVDTPLYLDIDDTMRYDMIRYDTARYDTIRLDSL